MKRSKATMLVFLSSMLLVGAALADLGGPPIGGPGFDMPYPGMMAERMADYLDLDDTQRDAVQNIMRAAQPEMDALREQLRENREALESLAADDPEVQNIAISNGELATEGTLLFVRVRGEIDAVLTDEQRVKLAEFKAQKQDRREHRKGRR
jgi:Spy/CpxP family protein refolding chaperone